jgi:RNA polymerase primary sigma factor
VAGNEAPSLIVSDKVFTCSNPKCSATGNVVDLVAVATDLPRHEAVGIVMKIKADQPVDVPKKPYALSGDEFFSDSGIEPGQFQRDPNSHTARDEVRMDRADEFPEDLNINAIIWNARSKSSVIAPDDILGAYVRQVGVRPLLDKGEESLLGREVREHREAYIGLMLKLDPILFQVGELLENVVRRNCSPGRVLAPTPASNGDQPTTRRSARPAVNALRKYMDLQFEVCSEPFCRRSLSYRRSTLANLLATRRKCVNHVVALGLRKSLLWDLYKQSLRLLEARGHNNDKTDWHLDDDLVLIADAACKDLKPATAGDLLKNLRYHFSEHVRCMQDLACHNLRLAIQMAIKYRRRGLPLEDLIQAANWGLLAACERFDERHGVRFSTYATWWIRQGIQRELDNFSTVIRLPQHVRSTLRDLQDYATSRYQETGHYPPVDELVQQTNLGEKIASRLLQVGLGIAFFSELGKDQYKALRHGTTDISVASPVQQAINSERQKAIAAVVRQKLSPRMQLVLTSRFGLDNGRERTLEEVAKQLDLTRERIRQIQTQALELLDVPELRRIAGLPPEVEELTELVVTEKPAKKRNYRRRKMKPRKKNR